MNYTDFFVLIFSVITIAFIIYACVLIVWFIFDMYYCTHVSEESTGKPTEEPIEEKRYVYVILGKCSLGKYPLSNEIRFHYIESDTKLTYQEIKDKFPSTEIMSINKLDRKTGKF